MGRQHVPSVEGSLAQSAQCSDQFVVPILRRVFCVTASSVFRCHSMPTGTSQQSPSCQTVNCTPLSAEMDRTLGDPHRIAASKGQFVRIAGRWINNQWS